MIGNRPRVKQTRKDLRFVFSIAVELLSARAVFLIFTCVLIWLFEDHRIRLSVYSSVSTPVLHKYLSHVIYHIVNHLYNIIWVLIPFCSSVSWRAVFSRTSARMRVNWFLTNLKRSIKYYEKRIGGVYIFKYMDALQTAAREGVPTKRAAPLTK